MTKSETFASDFVDSLRYPVKPDISDHQQSAYFRKEIGTLLFRHDMCNEKGGIPHTIANRLIF